jgi:methyl-accepting chemotaxis protein
MKANFSKPGPVGFLGRLSLTTKLAAVIIVVNLIGLGATVWWLYQSAEHTLRQDAFANWSREVKEVGMVAAGGVKWNVPEAIEDAYKGYTTSDEHDLVQIIVYNAAGAEMTAWTRSGADAATSKRSWRHRRKIRLSTTSRSVTARLRSSRRWSRTAKATRAVI